MPAEAAGIVSTVWPRCVPCEATILSQYVRGGPRKPAPHPQKGGVCPANPRFKGLTIILFAGLSRPALSRLCVPGTRKVFGRSGRGLPSRPIYVRCLLPSVSKTHVRRNSRKVNFLFLFFGPLRGRGGSKKTKTKKFSFLHCGVAAVVAVGLAGHYQRGLLWYGHSGRLQGLR